MSNIELEAINKSQLLPVKMQCEVDIQLHGLLASVKLAQTFTNTSDKAIEAIHSIPVPVESTLTDFTVCKNGETWRGKVLAKEQADQNYEAALEEGNGAFQLKKDKDDLFTLFLGNLLSKETLTLKMSLIFPIQFIAGQGQLYLPLVIGERYGNSNLLPESEVVNSFLAEYPVSIKLQADTLPIQTKITSPSHPMQQNEHVYEAQGYLNRDLKILFDDLPELNPSFDLIPTDNNQFAGLVSLIPTDKADHTAEPRDILFVLDCSGSMSGTPIQQLKESVYIMLSEMRPQDRFNIYLYGSHVTAMFDELQAADEVNITRAKQLVRRNIDADMGGTETISAMLMALMTYQKTRPADVMLITDGAIWVDKTDAETKLLKAYAKQNNIRFFTVGVGHATTEDTVKYLADISDGSSILTNPHEDIRFQMQAHFKRLFVKPFVIQMDNETLWAKTKTIQKYYYGDALLIPMWFDSMPETIDLTFSADSVSNDSYSIFPKLNDNPKLLKWIASQRYTDLIESEQTRFAETYQLLTDSTDYLIELERAESDKSNELPTMVKMPQMEVHGSFDASPGIMFSRRFDDSADSNDYMDTPAFLRRQIDESESSRFGDYVSEKLANYSEKRRIKQETLQIQQLVAHLESLIQAGLSLEYKKLHNLKAPDDLIFIMLRIELDHGSKKAIKLIIEVLKECNQWQDAYVLNETD